MNPLATQQTSVMLLAAGHGKRMLPLTNDTPKPLLKVHGRPLIEHHLLKLAQQGFRNIIINTAYLGQHIVDALGDGSQFGLNIRYSDESTSGALETAGGIKHALALISSDVFLVVNADIWTDYPFHRLLETTARSPKLVMVANPAHNLSGDFALNSHNGLLEIPRDDQQSHTFSGIALYNKALFKDLPSGPQALAPMFKQLIEQQKLSGEFYPGVWHDIGTPQRLSEINDLGG
jgi:MurNAc alpha-1-phosphate uridylyltransferase